MLGLGACATAGSTNVPPSAGESPVLSPFASSVAATPEVTAMPSAGPFTLTSAAFAEGGAIPREYSCQGADVSPALAWTGTPAGTAELVLIVDDPDAGGFIHWIIVVGGGEGGLPRALAPSAPNVVQGVNGFGKVGWGGPCPPSGTHHYRFTLSAVAGPTGLTGHPTISQVRAVLSSATVVGMAVLTGTYRKT